MTDVTSCGCVISSHSLIENTPYILYVSISKSKSTIFCTSLYGNISVDRLGLESNIEYHTIVYLTIKRFYYTVEDLKCRFILCFVFYSEIFMNVLLFSLVECLVDYSV